MQQVVHGVAGDLLARMVQLGGLNAPHSLFGGNIAAQAYDTAAFKVAAISWCWAVARNCCFMRRPWAWS